MSVTVLSAKSPGWLQKVQGSFLDHEPVALPTETVYGLAAPASDEIAVGRIYEIKDRPRFNPLIVHVLEHWDLSPYVDLGLLEKKLIEKFWPGPLSLLVKKKNISDFVTAGAPDAVIRSPAHPIFREVLNKLSAPLVAPSANSSTRLSPTTAQAVVDDIGSKLKYVVDGGSCEWGVESTIVKVEGDSIHVLREGALSRETLSLAGFKIVDGESARLAVTPGSQLRHYAPLVPLYLYDSFEKWSQPSSDATLYLQVLSSDYTGPFPFKNRITLATDSDLKTAAHNLFKFLKEAQEKYREIRVLKTSSVGLGRAINDRLERASERNE